jgi:hypothetical protein
LTLCTGRDVGVDQIPTHIRPVKIVPEHGIRLFCTEMPEVVMCEAEEVFAEVFVLQDDQSITKEYHSIS